MRSRPPYLIGLLLSALALLLASGLARLHACGPLVDEVAHGLYITGLLNGEGDAYRIVTTFPTYHWLVAGLGRLAGTEGAFPANLAGLRTLSLGMTLPALLVAAHSAARFITEETSGQLIRAAQLLCLPILLPYTGLVYTDGLAVALIVLAWSQALRERHRTAFLAALACVALRQQGIMILGVLLLHRLWNHYPVPAQWPGQWRPLLRDTWPYLAALAGFLVFLLWNGGVAVGDADKHALGLYPGNLFFLLLLAPVLLLPLFLHQLPGLIRHLRRHPAPLLLAGAGMALFVAGFEVSHPYNLGRPDYFLRNGFLLWLVESPLHRLALAPLIGWSILALPRLRLTGPGAGWMHLAGLLPLLFAQLIEQRYALPYLALLLAFRRPGPAGLETALLLWFAGWAYGITLLFASQRYFL